MSLFLPYSETFSFVLTGEDGSRRFGYCRRLLVCSQNILEMFLYLTVNTTLNFFSDSNKAKYIYDIPSCYLFSANSPAVRAEGSRRSTVSSVDLDASTSSQR